ncbi:FF domain protein [Pseudonocardia sp. Ae168_Ps1]|uniref:metal-dependent hydrolase n=2 Tax=Pseudonocardia TaxID=1847 RepID=UPI0001FFE246|nr:MULTISPECIES: metal-dependent hydrolase [unclassified Pseudonocardia]ALE72892.1 metal-dependent hydrolase [Pseudonocardia sp. EC080625-04]ALL83246.1 metal-dependent hydrolase [Pseudonocardia sp. EC080619-01]OLL73030.1 FF domain protein [Pseudonocardia sp. Ae150A_Ps1]OLL79005.1 FF domain protein [Pseudonocardia sp. Ae168_Ps1]OLL86857.1 FF domain protein [Pseudonocardia sp. Ae263_Ps1]
MSTADDDRIALHARDVRFDFSTLRTDWIPGEPFASHLIDVLHLLLPEGERWFVEVFSQALPHVHDEALAEDVRGFIGQEAMHATSHQGALDHLLDAGVDVSRYVEQVEWIFNDLLGDRGLTGDDAREWLVERVGLIAAIEHFTAVLGEWVLHSPELDAAGADPQMLDMLRWHGAEEVEHRSVAHDLYVHLDGRYLRRIRSMVVSGPALAKLWADGTRQLCARDPQLRGTPQRRVRLRDYLRASRRGLVPGPWMFTRAVLTYLSPRFHPARHGDTDAAVAYLALSPAARRAEGGEHPETGGTA